MEDDDTPSKPSRGLATASVVLGIIGLLLSVIRIGGALGLGGIFLGYRYLARHGVARRRAKIGIALSTAAVVLAGVTMYAQMTMLRRAHAAMTQWEGVRSPDFTLTTLDGTAIDSASLRGKRVLLDFWATWCVPCRFQMGALEQLVQQQHRDDVVVLGVSREDPATIRTFLAENPVAYPIVAVGPGVLPEPYSTVLAVPAAYIIDRNGVIQFGRVGILPPAELQRLVWDADDVSTPPKSRPTGDLP